MVFRPGSFGQVVVLTALSTCGIAAAGDFPTAEARLNEFLDRAHVSAPTGNLAHVRFERAEWVDDQRYEIASGPRGVVVRASGARGANYAVARIMRELGYHRLAPHPSWEVLPTSPPQSLALNVDEAPAYRTRRIWTDFKWPEARTSGHHEAWAFYRRLGGDDMRCGHAYGEFVRRSKAFFAEHPECLALVGGERKGTKLCISNPLLRGKFAEYALAELARAPSAASVSVEPSDDDGWCECADCAKLGTPTDRAMTLANHVAAEVRKKFPGKKVALYAYNRHSPPPNVAVDRDVVVFIATSFLTGGWTADALVPEWGRRATIGIREYYYNGGGRCVPSAGRAANVPLIASSLPSFHANGARYVTAEIDDSWAAGLVGFNVAAELMWNVKSDPKAVKADILQSAFPSAADEMGEFFSIIDGERKMPLSEDLLARMYAALSAAWKRAAEPRERERVAQMIGYAKYCEALLKYDRGQTEANANELFAVAAALKPYYTVYTACFHRDGRQFGDIGRKVANGFDWNTPRPLLPEKWLADGLANNRRIPFEVVDFGMDLVPAACSAAEAGKIRLGPLRGAHAFHVWCDGRPFDVGVAGGQIKWYRDRGNVKMRLVRVCGAQDADGREEAVWTDDSVQPDGMQHVVRVVPRRAGLHRLEVSDGGDETKYDFPEGLAVAVAVAGERLPRLCGDFWLFVPRGARTVGFFASTWRGLLCGPDGKTAFDLAKKKGHFSCEVPSGSDGRFWVVRDLVGSFQPLTVPAVLNLNPRKCLVPKGVE